MCCPNIPECSCAFKTPMKLWYCGHLLYYSPLSALPLCPSLKPWRWLLSASAPSTVYLTPALILPPFCSSLTENPNGLRYKVAGRESSSRLKTKRRKKKPLDGMLCVWVCVSLGSSRMLACLFTKFKINIWFWSRNASLLSLYLWDVYRSGKKIILVVVGIENVGCICSFVS